MAHTTETLRDDKVTIIRRDILETRAAIAEKCRVVELRVGGEVDKTKATIEENIQSVKDAMSIKYHVQTRPWTMFATAIAAGLLVGKRLGDARASSSEAGKKQCDWPDRAQSTGFVSQRPDRSANVPVSSMGQVDASRAEKTNGAQPHSGILEKAQAVGSQLSEHLSEEIEIAKGLAIGVAVAVARQLAAKALPEMVGPHIGELFHSLTKKLGGTPLDDRSGTSR